MKAVTKSQITISEINENISFGGVKRLGVAGQFLIISDCDEMDVKLFYAVRFDEVFESSNKEGLIEFANKETARIVAEAHAAMPKINAKKLNKTYQLG